MPSRVRILRTPALAAVGLFIFPVIFGSAQMASNSTENPWQNSHPNLHAGKISGDTVVLPTDQIVRPAGRIAEFRGRPTELVVAPGGGFAALLKSNFSGLPAKNGGAVGILDLNTMRLVQDFSPWEDATGSFAGLAFNADGSRLYASDPSGVITVASIGKQHRLSLLTRIDLPAAHPNKEKSWQDSQSTSNPGGLAFDPQRNELYVAMNMNDSLGVIDTKTNHLVAEIPVGIAPHAVAIRGQYAYVSNQGGDPASSADFTNRSAESQVKADRATGRPIEGTVSVVDLVHRKLVTSIAVGLQPTALMVRGNLLFVANTNSDSISVIDLDRRVVARTINVQPFPRAPFGSAPTALAMDAKGRLLIGLGGNNCIAVYAWQGLREAVELKGLIPTAWYPSSIAFDTGKKRMFTAALKGFTPDHDEHDDGVAGHDKAFGKSQLYFVGAVTSVVPPDDATLSKWTRQVYLNNRWDSLAAPERHGPRTIEATRLGEMAAGPRVGVEAKAIPERIGEPSKIKHVFYIIKENQKYDGVLGDDPRGDGVAGNLLVAPAVSPNHHALARMFPLFDNFYVSTTVSIDGHEWVNTGFANDYIERSFGGSFKRGYPFNGGDAMAYTPSGFIWENSQRHGLSVEVFGEFSPQFTGPTKTQAPWKDWFHDSKVLTGELNEPLRISLGSYKATTDIPSLAKILAPEYPGFVLAIPDQYRASLFARRFAAHVAAKDMPSLTILTLPNDHGVGEGPGIPVYEAQFADNDLAVGRIVDIISHSPYWAESAVFVVEDDASYCVDHIDGHRSPVFVASPYAKHGFVDHTYYTQIDVLRTIEQILGLEPMNQHDLVASPMTTSFTDEADLTPYQAVPNQIPLDRMTATSTENSLPKAWEKASKVLMAKIDDGDENMISHAIWYSAHQYKVPYPGESRLLWPAEVKALRKTAKDPG